MLSAQALSAEMCYLLHVKDFRNNLIKRFTKQFYMKCYRNNSTESFVKLCLCEQFQKHSCCISCDILQNSFRIVTHEMWKVEMILKPYWKFFATINIVWALTMFTSYVCSTNVLRVHISFRCFLSKIKHLLWTVHNVLFKVMAIASHYFFPSFW